MTSISLSTCLATWSTSAWPASTVTVIRERPSATGPTDSAAMLKPRRRTWEATRSRTPGWSSTIRLSTRSRLGITAGSLVKRCLQEVIERLAEGHDRVDVGLGVDAEINQERTRRRLRGVEGRAD